MRASYLNLARRVDRRAAIEAELARLGWAAERVEAVDTPERGAWGCALSHAAALRAFLREGSPRPGPPVCVVVEDDLAFVRDPRPDLARFFADFADEGWDVLLLASNTKIEAPVPGRDYVTRIVNAQTTAGYVVHAAYVPTLLACFEESARRLAPPNAWSAGACCDILWKALQPAGRWYCLRPRVALQRPGYSDIEGRDTFYGV